MYAALKKLTVIYPSIEGYIPFALAGLLFTIPVSSSAKSIFLVAAIVLIISSKSYRMQIRINLTQTWSLCAFLLVLYAVLASFWSSAATHEKLLILEKYSKWLLLPILAAGFRKEQTRLLGVRLFILAMLITCIISILSYLQVPYLNLEEPGAVFRNHIMTSNMMVFAAYLSAVQSIRNHNNRLNRLAFAGLAILFSIQILFINLGRTGYILYATLLTLLIMQTLPWRKALLSIVLLCPMIGVVYIQSPAIHNRYHQVIQDWQHFQQNKTDTSVGQRVQFHLYAYKLFKQHPWIGNGTASFVHSFSIDKPVSSWNRKLLEPHSQYWLTASEFGILGLSILALLFISLFRTSLQLDKMKWVSLALLISFLLGNLVDSLFLYSGTGYFFLTIMALCLGELANQEGGAMPSKS